MNTKTLVLPGLLIWGALSSWAQPAPQREGDPNGSAEMGEDKGQPPPPPQEGGQRGWGRMGPGGPGGSPGFELSAVQEKELLNFVKANEPELADNLSDMKEKDPPMYKRTLSGLWLMHEDPNVRDQWVKRTKANHDARILSAQYKSATDTDKPAIREKLLKAAGEVFDQEMADHLRQAESMEANLKLYKARIARRQEMKDKLVSRHVDELTGEAEDWQW